MRAQQGRAGRCGSKRQKKLLKSIRARNDISRTESQLGIGVASHESVGVCEEAGDNYQVLRAVAIGFLP